MINRSSDTANDFGSDKANTKADDGLDDSKRKTPGHHGSAGLPKNFEYVGHIAEGVNAVGPCAVRASMSVTAHPLIRFCWSPFPGRGR